MRTGDRWWCLVGISLIEFWLQLGSNDHFSIRCCWNGSGYGIVLASDVVTEVDRRDG